MSNKDIYGELIQAEPIEFKNRVRIIRLVETFIIFVFGLLLIAPPIYFRQANLDMLEPITERGLIILGAWFVIISLMVFIGIFMLFVEVYEKGILISFRKFIPYSDIKRVKIKKWRIFDIETVEIETTKNKTYDVGNNPYFLFPRVTSNTKELGIAIKSQLRISSK